MKISPRGTPHGASSTRRFPESATRPNDQILPLPWNNRGYALVAFPWRRDHIMAFKQGEQIVEPAQEARQAERGPTLRNMLIVSTGLVILAFAIIWLGSIGRWKSKDRSTHAGSQKA
jgi:hypothetical protein